MLYNNKNAFFTLFLLFLARAIDCDDGVGVARVTPSLRRYRRYGAGFKTGDFVKRGKFGGGLPTVERLILILSIKRD